MNRRDLLKNLFLAPAATVVVPSVVLAREMPREDKINEVLAALDENPCWAWVALPMAPLGIRAVLGNIMGKYSIRKWKEEDAQLYALADLAQTMFLRGVGDILRDQRKGGPLEDFPPGMWRGRGDYDKIPRYLRQFSHPTEEEKQVAMEWLWRYHQLIRSPIERRLA